MRHRATIAALVMGVLFASAIAAGAASTVTVGSGTAFHALMNQSLDSGTVAVGQQFTMQIVAPYPNGDSQTWSGANAVTHVVHAQHASQGRKAEVGFVFDRITLRNGASAQIHADLASMEQKKSSNLGHAALTTLGGMVAGNILGKWLGTNAGGAVGAVGGALYGINKKENFKVAAGSKAEFKLTESLTVVQPR